MAKLRIENRSGYETRDLERLVRAAVRYHRIDGPLDVVFVTAPGRSRGCAEVGGRRAVFALAPPSYDRSRDRSEFMRRLSRLIDHEFRHLKGDEHEDMGQSDLYSLGPASPWARGISVRYRGRASAQLPFLQRRAR